jgi:hypothetical protein
VTPAHLPGGKPGSGAPPGRKPQQRSGRERRQTVFDRREIPRDAIRLARQAAVADIQVTLDITPQVPHVFQAFYLVLDEAAAALDRAGQLLSAHLAQAERVTA